MAALAWMSIERRQCETNRLHGVDLVMAVKEARLLGWPQVIMWPQQAFKPARRRFPVSHYAESAKDSKTAIAPMLSVRSGAKPVELYKVAFGAGELFRLDNENGDVVARLSVGPAEFWVADESPEHLNFSPESLGGGSVRMVMIVEDTDSAFNPSVAAEPTVPSPVPTQDSYPLLLNPDH